jgi:hypothetical protein
VCRHAGKHGVHRRGSGKVFMIEPLLRVQLEPVARRHRRLRVAYRLAAWWLVVAGAGFAMVALSHWVVLPMLFLAGVIGSLALIGGTIVAWRASRWEPDYAAIVRVIETQYPELHTLLRTAAEQQPDPETGRYHLLQERLLREALQQSQRHSWLETVPRTAWIGASLAQLAALALVASVFVWASHRKPVLGNPFAWAEPLQITPGDVSIERGSGLTVLARFSRSLPSTVTLIVREHGAEPKRIPLSKSLDDPLFGGSVTEVRQDLTYAVEYDGTRTREFKVTTFEYPRLERADAHLRFPDYTKLGEKKIPETQRITAVEGTEMDLALQLNKPVKSARLISKDAPAVNLAASTNTPAALLPRFVLSTSRKYELQLVDFDGRTNKVPASFAIEVVKNATPELKFAFPKGDQRLSPLQEISLQGEAWDDFGLLACGVTYTMAGSAPVTVKLGGPGAAKQKINVAHLLKLEELHAAPDDLISYAIWADDLGPDGKVRRTSSDLYFAEVRPFDEIYRKAQNDQAQGGQQGGQGEQQSPATKLAELQKQIMVATWNLQRNAAPDEKYKKDAKVVRSSQEEALDKVNQLLGEQGGGRRAAAAEKVKEEMKRAVEFLEKAEKSREPLPSALAAEQAAYQALLKMASREFQVTQNRRGQGQGGGGQQRNQQQLDQLEMQDEANRYETQRQAAAPQKSAQREQLETLNRLKELAQRQQDINQRLKELQNSLQEARDEKQREEIQRQLKRLRDQERQMLSDVDDLAQRMDRSQNQSRLSDARKQLDQTRSEVQQASDALDNQSVPQALTSGTRAERNLEEMRDDFRKESAGQFGEEMRDLRNSARDLAKNQEEIGKQLENEIQNPQKSLRDNGNLQQLQSRLAEQSKKMTNLIQRMSDVTERAEQSEPLLSKQLYDAVRKASQGTADESLAAAETLLQRGLPSQATPFERRARQEIDELKNSVEQAANSVLGDETEALRVARQELTDLADQVRRETENRSASEGGQPGGAPGTNEVASGQGQARDGANRGASGGNTNGLPRYGIQQEGGDAQARRERGAQPGQSETATGQRQNGEGRDGRQARNNSRGPQGPGQRQGQRGQGQGQGESQDAQANAESPQDSNGNSQGQRPGGQRGQQGQQGRQAGNRGNQRGGQNRASAASEILNSLAEGGGGGSGPNVAEGPLTGENYLQWSERLGDVEQMLDDPELRRRVAGVREQARAVRMDYTKRGKKPDWAVVKMQISGPLMELRDRVAEELARRESREALVPLDRDPVPPKYSEVVRRYYERLGNSN